MTKRRRTILSVLIVSIVLFFLVRSCRPTLAQKDDLLLPTQGILSLYTTNMLALANGVLTVNKGCLTIGESGFTIIWPFGSRLHVDEGEISVRRFGQTIATVGQPLNLGGGGIQDFDGRSIMTQRQASKLVEQCGDGFWITNSVVEQ